jgi:NDP-sugar pyrophosphorylase family protein
MTQMPPLALLAGGLATRLRPLTEEIPKAMIKVAGEPFIAHQLRLVRREGITQVVLCVGYQWEKIRDYVGDGHRFGLKVEYAVDRPTLLGTGGALRKALDKLGPEFMVMYGDSWLDTAFAPIVEAFRASGKPVLMTVFRNDGRWNASNVWFEQGEIKCYDKCNLLPQMHHIDWGLSVIAADALLKQPATTPFDLAPLFGALVQRGELAGYEVKTRFYEIGSAKSLAETDAFLRSSSLNL